MKHHYSYNGLIASFVVGILVMGAVFLIANARNATTTTEAALLVPGSQLPFSYDVNHDGHIDFSDPEYIQRFVSGLEKSCPTYDCDFTGDGAVTTLDSARLISALINKFDTNDDKLLDETDVTNYLNALETYKN